MDYATDVGDLALMGLGGWTVTASIGVDVERQYVVFGSAGAITVMALSGLLFERLRDHLAG